MSSSLACQSKNMFHRGRASTASGSRNIAYCGDHTLFTRTNDAASKKAICATRGGAGARRTRTTIAEADMTNRTDTVTLRVPRLIGWWMTNCSSA